MQFPFSVSPASTSIQLKLAAPHSMIIHQAEGERPPIRLISRVFAESIPAFFPAWHRATRKLNLWSVLASDESIRLFLMRKQTVRVQKYVTLEIVGLFLCAGILKLESKQFFT